MNLRKTFLAACCCLALGGGYAWASEADAVTMETVCAGPVSLEGTWHMDVLVMNYPVQGEIAIEKDKDGWWLSQYGDRYKLNKRDNGALFFTSSYGGMATETEIAADEEGVVKITIKVDGQAFTSVLDRVEKNGD